MPMNNGNMPNTDGRGNGTRRTVRPDGSPLGNGAYQSGDARGNTAHTDGADSLSLPYIPPKLPTISVTTRNSRTAEYGKD